MFGTRIGWVVLFVGQTCLVSACAASAAPPPGPEAGSVTVGSLSRPAAAMSLGGVLGRSEEADLITASPGGIRVWPGHGDRGFTGSHAVPMPLVDPVAVAAIDQGVAVADRAANALVFARPDERGQLAAAGSVPVGTAPAAMAAIEIVNGDEFSTLLAVADQGSGDVALHNPDEDSPVERVEIGAAPGSIALTSTYVDGDTLVAAGTPVGVTVLAVDTFDGVEGQVRQRLAVPGGVTAVALAESPYSGETIDDDPFTDLFVARGDGALLVYHGTKGARFPTTPELVSAPGVVAAPARLFAGRFGGDRALDLAALGADGRATEFLGSLDGERVRAMPTIDSGVMPAAAIAGDVAGDDLDELVVAGRDGGALRTVVSGHDRSISSDTTAADLSAGSGHVVWWRRAGPRYQLVDSSAGRLRDVPVTLRARPVRTIVGVDADGHPVAAFVGCGSHGCGPYRATLPAGTAHPVALHLHVGCHADSVAISGADLAYGTVGGRRCPSSARGMWLHRAGSRPVRLTKRRGLLGDLDADHVAWNDYTSISARAWVRGDARAQLVGRITSPGVVDFLDGSFRGPLIGGPGVYWAGWISFTEGDTGTLYRASPSGARCQGTGRDLPTHRGELDAVADSGRVYYADHRGVFEANRSSLEWHAVHCLDQ